MEGSGALCMIGGDGDTSYAKNSLLQLKVIAKTTPITQEAVMNICRAAFPNPFCIADLGCSSGQNNLLVISEIIRVVEEMCKKLGHKKLPEFQVYLNDLPLNDFNTLFRSLPEFQENLKKQYGPDFGPCLFNGVPRSFYERLFLKNSIHFIHSSYSIHWLSKVPDLIELNKGNVYLNSTTPASILKAYYNQFQTDFINFLEHRAEEIVKGGFMVLTCIGRESEVGFTKCWEVMSMVLREMISEGLIEEEKLDLFNVPVYTPSPSEIQYIVEKQGSFTIDRIEISKVNWIGFGEEVSSLSTAELNDAAEKMSKLFRAIGEPILVSQFGDAIMDDVFKRYRDIVADVMVKDRTNAFINVVASLTKTE